MAARKTVRRKVTRRNPPTTNEIRPGYTIEFEGATDLFPVIKIYYNNGASACDSFTIEDWNAGDDKLILQIRYDRYTTRLIHNIDGDPTFQKITKAFPTEYHETRRLIQQEDAAEGLARQKKAAETVITYKDIFSGDQQEEEYVSPFKQSGFIELDTSSDIDDVFDIVAGKAYLFRYKKARLFAEPPLPIMLKVKTILQEKFEPPLSVISSVEFNTANTESDIFDFKYSIVGELLISLNDPAFLPWGKGEEIEIFSNAFDCIGEAPDSLYRAATSEIADVAHEDRVSIDSVIEARDSNDFIYHIAVARAVDRNNENAHSVPLEDIISGKAFIHGRFLSCRRGENTPEFSLPIYQYLVDNSEKEFCLPKDMIITSSDPVMYEFNFARGKHSEIRDEENILPFEEQTIKTGDWVTLKRRGYNSYVIGKIERLMRRREDDPRKTMDYVHSFNVEEYNNGERGDFIISATVSSISGNYGITYREGDALQAVNNEFEIVYDIDKDKVDRAYELEDSHVHYDDEAKNLLIPGNDVTLMSTNIDDADGKMWVVYGTIESLSLNNERRNIPKNTEREGYITGDQWNQYIEYVDDSEIPYRFADMVVAVKYKSDNVPDRILLPESGGSKVGFFSSADFNVVNTPDFLKYTGGKRYGMGLEL